MEALRDAMAKLNKQGVLDAVKAAIESDQDPQSLIEDIRVGLEEVGNQFESGGYFLMELMRGAQIFKEAAALINPEIEKKLGAAEKKGKVLLATVAGDVHDLGKSIVLSLMECNGYEVMDLGVDVPIADVVEKTKEFEPAVVGLSGLLTTSIPIMTDTVKALSDAGVRDKVKIIVGGGIVGEVDTSELGVDHATCNANDGVRVIESWFGTNE